MAVIFAVLLLLAPSINLKAQAARDFIRLTAYVPVAHDEAYGWVDCPGGYRSSAYQRERRQHQFDWRFRGCPSMAEESPCVCEVGIRIALRGQVVAQQTTQLIVPF